MLKYFYSLKKHIQQLIKNYFEKKELLLKGFRNKKEYEKILKLIGFKKTYSSYRKYKKGIYTHTIYYNYDHYRYFKFDSIIEFTDIRNLTILKNFSIIDLKTTEDAILFLRKKFNNELRKEKIKLLL